MAAPRSVWRADLDAALEADPTRWWDLDALVARAGHLIPPGRAHRAGLLACRHGRPGDGTRSTPAMLERAGRRRIISEAARQATAAGAWERDGDGHGRRWRWAVLYEPPL